MQTYLKQINPSHIKELRCSELRFNTYIKNNKNAFLLFYPTQFDIQGQWWSILVTHLLHCRQWCDLGGLTPLQIVQVLYSLDFKKFTSSMVKFILYSNVNVFRYIYLDIVSFDYIKVDKWSKRCEEMVYMSDIKNIDVSCSLYSVFIPSRFYSLNENLIFY